MVDMFICRSLSRFNLVFVIGGSYILIELQSTKKTSEVYDWYKSNKNVLLEGVFIDD
jgi:hypothetical protein